MKETLKQSLSPRSARIWLQLFNGDHQVSFGVGRPPMLSYHYVHNHRAFLDLPPPLSNRSDVRLISTLELMIIRERYHDVLAPYDAPIDERMASDMRAITDELRRWCEHWSAEIVQRGYAQDSFMLHSLRLQRATAELYLSCTSLRSVRGASPTAQPGSSGSGSGASSSEEGALPALQANMIRQATSAAHEVLEIANGSASYRANLAHAPSYTYVTSTFAAVFLVKVARLSSGGLGVGVGVDVRKVFDAAESLAGRLAEIPASGKYAHLIRTLLQAAWQEIAKRSPEEGLHAVFGHERLPDPGMLTPVTGRSVGAGLASAGGGAVAGASGAGSVSGDGLALLQQLLVQHQQHGANSGTATATAAGSESPANHFDIPSQHLRTGAGARTDATPRTSSMSLDAAHDASASTPTASGSTVGNAAAVASASGPSAWPSAEDGDDDENENEDEPDTDHASSAVDALLPIWMTQDQYQSAAAAASASSSFACSSASLGFMGGFGPALGSTSGGGGGGGVTLGGIGHGSSSSGGLGHTLGAGLGSGPSLGSAAMHGIMLGGHYGAFPHEPLSLAGVWDCFSNGTSTGTGAGASASASAMGGFGGGSGASWSGGGGVAGTGTSNMIGTSGGFGGVGGAGALLGMGGLPSNGFDALSISSGLPGLAHAHAHHSVGAAGGMNYGGTSANANANANASASASAGSGAGAGGRATTPRPQQQQQQAHSPAQARRPSQQSQHSPSQTRSPEQSRAPAPRHM